ANIDLAPTFVELAGGSAPDSVDGRSLVGLFAEEPTPLEKWRTDLLIEHFDSHAAKHPERSPDEEGGIPEYSALRSDAHLYVEYPGTRERELYDLHKDPWETQSFHDEARPGLLKKLADRLDALRRCAGASCRD